MLHLPDAFDAIEIEGGYRVVANGNMDTAFLPVVGMRTDAARSRDRSRDVGRQIRDRARARQHRLDAELRPHRGAARRRRASWSTTSTSEEGAEDRVKMALVPFVTAVNIRGDGRLRRRTWIDPIGADPAHPSTELRPSRSTGSTSSTHSARHADVEWKGCVEARARRPRRGRHAADRHARRAGCPISGRTSRDDGPAIEQLLSATTAARQRRLRAAAQRRQILRSSAHARREHDEQRPERRPARGPIVELTNDTDRMQRRDPDDEAAQRAAATTPAPTSRRAWSGAGACFRRTSRSRRASPTTTTTTTRRCSCSSPTAATRSSRTTRSRESDYTSYGYLADGRLGSTDNYLVAERERGRQGHAHLRERQGQGHPPLHDPLPGRLSRRRRTSSANCASKDEDGKPLYYYVPDAATARNRLPGHRQGPDDAPRHPLSLRAPGRTEAPGSAGASSRCNILIFLRIQLSPRISPPFRLGCASGPRRGFD